MTQISIKPKGADGPVLTGERVESNRGYYVLQLANGVAMNNFHKSEWEEVLTLPTKPGWYIAAVRKDDFAKTGATIFVLDEFRGWREYANFGNKNVEEQLMEDLKRYRGLVRLGVVND